MIVCFFSLGSGFVEDSSEEKVLLKLSDFWESSLVLM